jgi:hypothetical protein
MPTKTETLLSSLKINKLTRSQFLTAKAADEVDLDNEFYMTGEVLGEGDMLKEVYDKNGNGIVDNSEKVNGLTVLTAVPANAKFTDTTYSTFKGATSSAAGSVGLVPMPQTGATDRYLCGDGTWKIVTHPAVNNPTITITQNGVSKGSFTLNQIGNQTIELQNTTYSVFGKSGSTARTGLVPAPSSTAGSKNYLREDGIWAIPPDTTYGVVTWASNGLAPKLPNDSTQFFRGDGEWAVPPKPKVSNSTITIRQAGVIKGTFTLNQSGDATIDLTDADTIYGVVSTTANGLVSKLPGNTSKFFRGDGTWASVTFSGGTVANATTFSSNVTVNGTFNYDGGFY